MNNQSKKVPLLVTAVIISVIVLVLIVSFWVSSMHFPRNQDYFQYKNELKIPPLLLDRNADPNTADFVLDVQSGETVFF